MDMKKFEEAVTKIGGRFKTTSILRERLHEMVKNERLKTDSDYTTDKILDKIISGQITLKEKNEPGHKNKEK